MGTKISKLWPETRWNGGELYWILGLQKKNDKTEEEAFNKLICIVGNMHAL
jgi:hypothetical protein